MSVYLVPKYYEMDPLAEDLLYDGSSLKAGMTVLVGDPAFRCDVRDPSSLSEDEYYRAKIRNRWMVVSNLDFLPRDVSFIGIFEDGTKAKITIDGTIPWLVKVDTIPRDSYASDPISVPKHNGDQTQMFPRPDGLLLDH